MKPSDDLIYGVIGDGRWSNIYRSSITKIGLKQFFINPIILVDNQKLSDFLTDNNSSEKVYVIATDPEIQLKAVDILADCKNPVIVEKPLCYDEESFLLFKKSIDSRLGKNLAGFFDTLNHSFRNFKKEIFQNKSKLKNISIYEGANGPYRRNSSAFYDWSPHVFSILQALEISFQNGRVLSKKTKRGSNYEIFLNSNGVEIKAEFGTGFSKKTRRIEAYFEDSSCLIVDLLQSSNRKYREMDRLLRHSQILFSRQENGSILNIYSNNSSNDDFLVENARLTMSFGKIKI